MHERHSFGLHNSAFWFSTCPAPVTVTCPVPVTVLCAGERGFAGSLLASFDEAMLRARLQEQLEQEEAAMSEHESDDSGDDLPQASLQQQQRQQQQDEDGEEEGGNVQQQRQQQQGGPSPSAVLPPKSISTPAAASAGRTEAAKAGAQVARAAAQQQQQQRLGRVDMGPDAMARRRHDFLLEMQHRFLDGLDGEHQDYAAIDADSTLDDDWAKEQAQDAEDAYFDAE